MLAWFAKRLRIRTRRQFRMTFRGLAVFLVAATGYAVAVLLALSAIWWSVIPFLVLLAASIAEFALGDYFADRSYPIETEQKLEWLEQKLGARAIRSIEEKLKRIVASFEACDTSRVSGTVHILTPLPPSPEAPIRQGLLQLTDYVGQFGGRKGRVLPIERGVIGRCARTGKTEVANFASLEEYRRRMVEEFGFSSAQISEYTTIARSYIAEPLVFESNIIGVLYFFSSEPQVFPHSASNSNLAASALDLVDLLKAAAMV